MYLLCETRQIITKGLESNKKAHSYRGFFFNGASTHCLATSIAWATKWVSKSLGKFEPLNSILIKKILWN